MLTPQEKKEIYDLMYEEYGDVGQNGNVIKLFERLLDKKLKQQLEEIESEIEELRPESCNCSTGKNECEHWGTHETVDSAKAIISKYKNL